MVLFIRYKGSCLLLPPIAMGGGKIVNTFWMKFIAKTSSNKNANWEIQNQFMMYILSFF